MSKQDNKITKINNLHKYLKDELDKELITKYPYFKIIENFTPSHIYTFAHLHLRTFKTPIL